MQDQPPVSQNPDQEPDRAVTVGEGQRVSMKLLQDVYNEITGKSEKLTQIFNIHHKCSIEDIYQLNEKIRQIYEQYYIESENCDVTVYHVDDNKQQFSSFERFKLYDKSNVNPIENIRLKYNFLIVPPQLSRPQSYTIEVNIHSRVAMQHRAKKEAGPPKAILKILSQQTGRMDIEYVDYMVARTFSTAINQWFHGLEQTAYPKTIKALEKVSDFYQVGFRVLTCAIVVGYFYISAPEWFLQETRDLEGLFLVSLVAFGATYIASTLAGKMGLELQKVLDEWQPISCLNVNRGDEKAINEAANDNKKNALKGVTHTVFLVAVNVVAMLIAAQLL